MTRLAPLILAFLFVQPAPRSQDLTGAEMRPRGEYRVAVIFEQSFGGLTRRQAEKMFDEDKVWAQPGDRIELRLHGKVIQSFVVR